MPPSKAQVTADLVAELLRLDDGKLPIAELNRRLGAAAEALGLQRPSYECVRVLVHEQRAQAWPPVPSTSEVLVDIAFRLKPATAIVDHLEELERREKLDRARRK
jgi:hypothetical protein